MAKNSELREKICSVFADGNGLSSKEIVKRVCEKYKEISQKQIHNFLWNNTKNGTFYKDDEGKYYLLSGDTSSRILENKMYNNFKTEIDTICKRYMKAIEDPFDKFEGSELLEAQKVYAAIKKIKKII